MIETEWCSFLARMNCGNSVSEPVAGKEAVSSHITLSIWSVIRLHAIMIITDRRLEYLASHAIII